ncbi:DgyrCDS11233 [Dimorphilus gyrociliatus]|uniref:Proteasome subunit beta n=1 Tax=Dimorphilus gyrociliatus TaxID=2664684 RepID=A0A7I8W2N6_9ANNE|nr:DgyrCDS11233 [Dimorphilus gyrociliatus]
MNYFQGNLNKADYHDFPQKTVSVNISAKNRTLYPTVTGTSVLGVKFDGGVIIGADNLGSYGSLARFRGCERVMKVNDTTILGASGDYADYQHLKGIIEQKVVTEECLDDGFNLTPKSLFSWLRMLMYSKRSNFDPLWNTTIIGGLENNEPFLGYVDKIGTAYESTAVGTGYGAYIALPLLREATDHKPPLTEQQALDLMEKCFRVLYYRDARSLNKYQVAIVTKDGCRILSDKRVNDDWSIAPMVRGYE